MTIDIEPSFILELIDQLKDSADNKDESSLPHPSRLYYNYNLVYIKLMFFNVSIVCRRYDMIPSDYIKPMYNKFIVLLVVLVIR